MAHIVVPPEFAGRVGRLMNDIGASELARRSGIRRQTLYQWRNGSAPESVEQVEKLATAGGTSVEALIGAEVRSDWWRDLTISRLRALLVELESGGPGSAGWAVPLEPKPQSPQGPGEATDDGRNAGGQ